ncbi:uncharacterized protein LOC144100261 [Amblyomma americanum]
MPMALMGTAAAPIDTRIDKMGGISCGPDGAALHGPLYVFDPSRESCAELPELTEKRAFFLAVSVQRHLWPVGGVVELKPEVKCTTRIDLPAWPRPHWSDDLTCHRPGTLFTWQRQEASGV